MIIKENGCAVDVYNPIEAMCHWSAIKTRSIGVSKQEIVMILKDHIKFHRPKSAAVIKLTNLINSKSRSTITTPAINIASDSNSNVSSINNSLEDEDDDNMLDTIAVQYGEELLLSETCILFSNCLCVCYRCIIQFYLFINWRQFDFYRC